MRFPLAQRHLIRGCAAHKAAGLDCAADYRANYVALLAHRDGRITRLYTGAEGGKWLWIEGDDGVSVRHAHLSEYKVKEGQLVKEGQSIGVTGNSGNITSGPHLHTACFKNGKSFDPETYFSLPLPMIVMMLRNIEDGSFAFTKDNKKQPLETGRQAALAAITLIQKMHPELFKNVSAEEYNKVPNTTEFFGTN